MPWVGAAVGGAATLIGGAMQSDATSSAAAESAAVQREQIAMQRELAEQSRQDLMPFANTGRNALLVTADLAGVNGADAARNALAGFVESPGRQFAFDEGLRAIDRSAARNGMLLSGNTIRAAEQFGQGLADQSFGTYYNRLADLAKGGQAAAAGQQQANSVLSGQIGEASRGLAQTAMSAGAAQASIYGDMASNLGGAVNNGLANYRYQQQTQPQQNALYDESLFSGAGTATGGYQNAGW